LAAYTVAHSKRTSRAPSLRTAWKRSSESFVFWDLHRDTIEVEPAIDGEEEVRLIGVDTPETKDPEEDIEPYGPEASKYTSTELEGEKVELEFDIERRDQYGRVLAYVYPMGEDMFNKDLLELGYAQVYTVSPNDKYDGKFEEAQEEAMDDDIGIWGLSRNEQCKLADRGNGIGEGTPQCMSRQQPAPEPQPAPAPAPTGRDLDCADFDSEGEAQAVLEDDSSDPHGLDADGDGQACEEGVGSAGSSTASPSPSPSPSPPTSPPSSPSPSPEPAGGLPPPPPEGDYDCDDLTYSQAQQVLALDRSDPHDLDGDANGIACE
jgi:micrococcal nuclease